MPNGGARSSSWLSSEALDPESGGVGSRLLVRLWNLFVIEAVRERWPSGASALGGMRGEGVCVSVLAEAEVVAVSEECV